MPSPARRQQANTRMKRRALVVIIGVFAILYLGVLSGVRFENIYTNQLVGLFLLTFPIYGFFTVLAWKPKKTYKKVTLMIPFVISVLVCIPFILFTAIEVFSTARGGGVDPAFEQIGAFNLNSYRIATYRSDFGAVTEFDVAVRSENSLFPGVYIEHELFDVDGASDVTLSVVDEDSFRIDSINFDSSDYRAYYLSNNPKVTEGQIIKVN